MNFIMKKILKILTEGEFLGYLIKEFDQWVAGLARKFMCMITPVDENKILFVTQEDRYCCNPKYICEEFRKRNADHKYDLVFTVFDGVRGDIPSDVRIVTRNTFDYYQEMFSAKYIFTNSILYCKRPFTLKKEQVLIETWHGSLGIKRFGKKEYKSGVHWVRGAIKTGKLTKYCISNSTFEDEVYKGTYWPKSEILRLGHARNDIFFANHKEESDEIRRKVFETIGIPSEYADAHLILYGPTFRDSKAFDCYNIDVQGVIDAFTQRFGGKWIFLKRYHNSVRQVYSNRNQIEADRNSVFDVTDYPDMQELIVASDVAITDYSSWIYDFVLTRKPGFIFALDVDLYNNERGFYYPLEATPFPIAKTNQMMFENIRNFDAEKYAKDVEVFLSDKGCIDDGHAAERIVDQIELFMNQK